MYIDVLCIIDLMVLQHRADTDGSVAAVIRDTCSDWSMRIGSCDSLGVLFVFPLCYPLCWYQAGYTMDGI